MNTATSTSTTVSAGFWSSLGTVLWTLGKVVFWFAVIAIVCYAIYFFTFGGRIKVDNDHLTIKPASLQGLQTTMHGVQRATDSIASKIEIERPGAKVHKGSIEATPDGTTATQVLTIRDAAGNVLGSITVTQRADGSIDVQQAPPPLVQTLPGPTTPPASTPAPGTADTTGLPAGYGFSWKK